MMVEFVTGVIVFLFLVAAGLLAYGARAFGRPGEQTEVSQVNMGREVLWTGLAAALLLGVFLYAHR
jgi:predicted secreted protein